MATCVVTLPAVSADLCDPKAHFGEIGTLLYTRYSVADQIDDPTDGDEWGARISNSTALPSVGTAAPVRYLYGKGELPLPEDSETEISLDRIVSDDPTHTLTFNVDDTGDTNAAALAALQNKNYQYAVWFIADGQLYGGIRGFKASVRFKGRIIPGAKTEVQTIQVTARWKGVLTAPIAVPAELNALLYE